MNLKSSGKRELGLFVKLDRIYERIEYKLQKRILRIYPSIAGPLLFVILSLLIIFLMPSQIRIVDGQMITARTFPFSLAVVMLGGSVLILLRELVKVFRKVPLETVEFHLLTELRAFILLLDLIVYALLMPLIGFIASSVVFGVLMLLYFRIKNWKYYALVSGSAILIGALFKYLLHVRLP